MYNSGSMIRLCFHLTTQVKFVFKLKIYTIYNRPNFIATALIYRLPLKHGVDKIEKEFQR